MKHGILATPHRAGSASDIVFWAFAASVLILILTITISNRGAVRVVGGIVLAVLLLIGLVQRLTNKPSLEDQRGKPSSPAAVITAVPIDLITLSDLQLMGNGAPFELRGTLHNASTDFRLRSITLRLVRRDCFEGALDPSGCAVIWQDQHWIQLDIPAQTERKFAASFYAHTNVPRPRGTIKDDFVLLAAAGNPDSR